MVIRVVILWSVTIGFITVVGVQSQAEGKGGVETGVYQSVREEAAWYFFYHLLRRLDASGVIGITDQVDGKRLCERYEGVYQHTVVMGEVFRYRGRSIFFCEYRGIVPRVVVPVFQKGNVIRTFSWHLFRDDLGVVTDSLEEVLNWIVEGISLKENRQLLDLLVWTVGTLLSQGWVDEQDPEEVLIFGRRIGSEEREEKSRECRSIYVVLPLVPAEYRIDVEIACGRIRIKQYQWYHLRGWIEVR